MNKRNLFTIGGAAAFGLALFALPASPARGPKAGGLDGGALAAKDR